MTILRICIISPYDITHPAWGSARRLFDLAESLGNVAEVFLLQSSYCPPESLAKQREVPENVTIVERGGPRRRTQVLNPRLIFTGFKMARRLRFDYLIASFPWTGIQAYPISVLTRTPLVMDEHNVEYKRLEELGKGNRLTRKLVELAERFCCRRARFVFSVSENDRGDLMRLFELEEDKVLLVPNGVNTDLFKPDPQARAVTRDRLGVGPDTRVVLFVGNLVYPPNRAAVEKITNEIAPWILDRGHDARFVMVGEKAPGFESGGNILFTGLVESVAEYYNACDVSIAPLLSGGGTRLKILESLGCGRRVVSTSKGAEGIEACDSLVISDDWSDFPQKVVDNWDCGYDDSAVEFARRYDWDSTSSDFCRVLRERLRA